ncbi:PREDICTED: bcl-2-related ovarian killer protein-like [Ceratosolen solmsi marchali]|uniref:Bcl-2-related ovarian killer protein-like n=1 Tax=Ceratosolen solmsi marchali TaxID=326594 RepID=A0AAJ6YRJ6_9HYME|nr:PREDICTED: bcl-2-related ovarian killer protein-like [Ceratosolen solmsi marchali]XP_011502887.1 PREDICTED: bcl-2-related ovarian killer protein-like [Ceratosolen solmsi marchali]XP_011502888.1 PREDICTED: bcl-2-related ovarian killer protein-like [Ceratosolen solmsi marchali]
MDQSGSSRLSNLQVRTEETRSFRRGSLAANLIGLGGHPDAFDVARRRLSNVSDVVSRKISRTIGWRSLSVSVELTVSQGTSLCAQYMRNRLKRSGIFRRKLGLKRMRSAKLLSGGALVAEVYPELAAVGTELERMHPKLFERVGRQIGCGAFRSEQRVTEALTDVAREMLRTGECSWEKIVALYAIAGGMAVDCVRQGKPEFLVTIQRAMAMVLEEDLAAWIQANGGWNALIIRYRPVLKQIGWQTNTVILFIAITTIFISILSTSIRIFLL